MNQQPSQKQQQRLNPSPMSLQVEIEMNQLQNNIMQQKQNINPLISYNKGQDKLAATLMVNVIPPIQKYGIQSQSFQPNQQIKSQQKQNSNDDLNIDSDRQNQVFPSQIFNFSSRIESQFHLDQNIQPKKSSVTKTYQIIRFCYGFKRQYAMQLCRIIIYALISISVFALLLDKNNGKKQFYEAFYSSQQITISKNINGVFPPLMGEQKSLIGSWEIQSFNANLNTNLNSLQAEFKLGGILYVSSKNKSCMDQLKLRWRVFYHNMQIHEYVQSQFQKIDLNTSTSSCLGNSSQIIESFKKISIWTVNWTSYQLYLLCESINKNKNRENSLIVLKKVPINTKQ